MATYVWKLRASEVAGLIGRHKYTTTSKAVADVFARHHKTRWNCAKTRAGVMDPTEIGRIALRGCGAAKTAIGEAVVAGTKEATERALENVLDALMCQEQGVMTRTRRQEFDKRAKCAVDVAKKIIYTEIGKNKEDKGLDQHAKKIGRDVGRRNASYHRLDGPGFIVWGMIDGYDETTRTVIEHKQRQNRLFRRLPNYERVQCFLYMRMTNSRKATLVQTFGDEQSTFDVFWDDEEWESIYAGIIEAVGNLNQLLKEPATRVDLAKLVYK